VRSFRGESAAMAVAVAGFVAPILLSLQLAWNQSIATEKAKGLRYAAEVVRRSEETGAQFYRAAQLLNHDHFAPCSPPEIDLMREIDIGSSYIQMVGRISGQSLVCTSLGTPTPIALGEPNLVTENGVSEWMDFKLGDVRLDRLDLLEYQGVAILVDTHLLVDQETESDVRLALIVPSTASRQQIVGPKVGLYPNWLNPIDRGKSISFLDNGFVVSKVRSKNLDIQAISAMPLSYAYIRLRRFAFVFVPIGLLCGAALAWAAMRISLNRSSPRGLIREAARNRDFFVEYQPVVELATRRIVGAEALVRWQRGNTVFGPASFIKLAEDTGVISLITANVMEIVARDLPKLLKLDREFHVAVNLSASDLNDITTREHIAELMSKSGASPRNLVIEATEHGLVGGSIATKMIKELRDAGICVAIDDFGTGYSSLSCLQNLGLDALKIDKSFVDTIGTGGPTSDVVLHIIEMARSLRLSTVAEGVETEAQAEFLLQRKVDLAQGWLFSKAMSIDALCNQLRQSGRVENEEAALLSTESR